jgi:membrane associated rhomboid family serine protease
MRYQYTSPGYRRSFQSNYSTPNGVKYLILINIIVFVLVEISGAKYSYFFQQFGLVPQKVLTESAIWQPFTYLFLHGGFVHILFNMFVLWMFGKDLERVWGQTEFFKYYFISGFGAGLVTILFSSNSHVPIVGASGAIYGLLLAYGLMYPNRLVYLYGIFPIKVKFMVAALALIAFFASLSPEQSTISHLTHLSGMGIGFLYLRSGTLKKRLRLVHLEKEIKKEQSSMKNKRNMDVEFRKKVDSVLEKLNETSWEELTKEEQHILQEASQRFHQNRPPN